MSAHHICRSLEVLGKDLREEMKQQGRGNEDGRRKEKRRGDEKLRERTNKKATK